jgi:hypothetical protein
MLNPIPKATFSPRQFSYFAEPLNNFRMKFPARNACLSLFLILSLMLLVPATSCRLLKHDKASAAERKAEKKKAKTDKKAVAEYDKAVKQHNKNQSKESRKMMKQTRKKADRFNKPAKRGLFSSRRCS